VAHDVLSKTYWEIKMQIDKWVLVIREQPPLTLRECLQNPMR